ncbi:energy transducer TonB [Uruburuella testudinis]|uniref:Energy transducer TonB n=1 Tax=Uruburuella testudinis TaxID=1282863 RepID=A0ABY4DVZ7_9NEIS|nr:TonB family protein [Uruburuella testudinis]UOO82830.1 energy transducer TonB [Uruburuella testudinis]
MNIQKLCSTCLAFTLLTGAQTALANDILFYQKASEAHTPISGNVAMRLTLDTDGRTRNVHIIRSSGSPHTDRLAVEWMQRQTMQPVTQNNRPIEFSFVKEIKFSHTDTLITGMR